MILNLKYFYEKTDSDFYEYNKLWDDNRERIIHLQSHLPSRQQRSCLSEELNRNDINKDILAVRFPKNRTMTHNKIIQNILNGKGLGIPINSKKSFSKIF